MNSKEFLPPYPYVQYIADHCPDTLSTYLFLWRNKDKNLRCLLTHDEICNTYSFSFTKFLNFVKKLARNDLLEWAWAQDVLVITLADHKEEDCNIEELFLC